MVSIMSSPFHSLLCFLFLFWLEKKNPFDIISFLIMVCKSAKVENASLAPLSLVYITLFFINYNPQTVICVITCMVCKHSIRCKYTFHS